MNIFQHLFINESEDKDILPLLLNEENEEAVIKLLIS